LVYGNFGGGGVAVIIGMRHVFPSFT